MANFNLISEKKPSGDQAKAINAIIKNFEMNNNKQVLFGATGTGKTFTIANIINKLNLKTFVLAPNKTLAAQLYSELKEIFPNNHVEYFVSYFDFYQPEAYIPSKDVYIEKTSKTNKEIEMLRISTLNSLASKDDVIVVASVAAIYASVSSEDFSSTKIFIEIGQIYNIRLFIRDLINLGYKRNDISPEIGNFRLNGDVVEICPGFTDLYLFQISFLHDSIEKIAKISKIEKICLSKEPYLLIYSANEYVTNKNKLSLALNNIENEAKSRSEHFKSENKLIESQRIIERTMRDIEAIEEFGFCGGIENYSRHLEFRKKGETPYTIFDFVKNDFLLVIDESHLMLPQIRGMYNTDYSRKSSLVDYGFRLPSALDNRPLNYQEFERLQKKVIYVSATPSEYEVKDSNNYVVEQIVRPTFLVDPEIFIKPSSDQINEVRKIIQNNIKNNSRTIITVLTIKMSEELTNYLNENNIKTMFLHNNIKTLERVAILNELRKGTIDAIVGINLLREGLDLPEVSTVIIIDADKPGFFRSDKSLIQLIGRASRNLNGCVYMFADIITPAMDHAIKETNRRRDIQIKYNKENNLTPIQISKPIDEEFSNISEKILELCKNKKEIKIVSKDKKQMLISLKIQMKNAAKKQEYERAAYLRDMIIEIENK
ncbi:MAG: excinuclease ABC subunit UvrB [Mycoplasmoidaceae bacterium]